MGKAHPGIGADTVSRAGSSVPATMSDSMWCSFLNSRYSRKAITSAASPSATGAVAHTPSRPRKIGSTMIHPRKQKPFRNTVRKIVFFGRPVDWKNLTEQEKMKYEIAGELGLLDQVMREGWKSLSSKETGRIGGLMTKKRRQEQKK